jgi:hypothetical protein
MLISPPVIFWVSGSPRESIQMMALPMAFADSSTATVPDH